ncbi:heterodisulfide reductase-related iron-sulfur binding cluster [Lysobacter sp. F60174L2]|uniref:heterodisulfide reductase-related iron-sulfur binding cluster n=1 Tax=Lysobacter sp. F60174L2 TaxID=3459295 RepID=UPI00403D6BF2
MPFATRPPPADPLVALADRCVQCGLCLPACPTYRHDQLEAESPRGRIALARAWALDTIEPTAIGDSHLDHCLGCRSCEAVCPAGVEYGALLVETRRRQRSRRRPGLRRHLATALVARPRLLARLLALYRLGHPLLPRRWRLLPPPPAPAQPVEPVIASPVATESAALFIGCIAQPYESATRDALARLCAALSIELRMPAAQTCCGSLHAHAGDTAAAERLAAANRVAFAGQERVLTLASGCHEAVATALGPAAIDALAFLDSRRAQLHFAERRERVALHLPCTQRNVVRSAPALRRLLAQVPGLTVVELDAGFGCCGAAGLQMLTDPGRATDYRQPLLDQFAASGATALLSANIGCRLHLAGGTDLPVRHPLEFLADALAPAPPSHRPAVESTP